MAKAKTTQEQVNIAKRLQGVVHAVSSDKTLQVRIENKFSHPLYGKIIKTHKNYLVHCEDESVKLGDKVIIQEGKPVSKRKKFYFIAKV